MSVVWRRRRLETRFVRIKYLVRGTSYLIFLWNCWSTAVYDSAQRSRHKPRMGKAVFFVAYSTLAIMDMFWKPKRASTPGYLGLSCMYSVRRCGVQRLVCTEYRPVLRAGLTSEEAASVFLLPSDFSLLMYAGEAVNFSIKLFRRKKKTKKLYSEHCIYTYHHQ